ncbi:MAG: trypsin-like peptidase domain-containing protein [Anaerolineales bacterium]
MNWKKTTWILLILVVGLASTVLGGLAGGYYAYARLDQIGTTESAPPETQTPTLPATPTPGPAEISSVDYASRITDVVEKTSPAVVTVLAKIPGQMTFFGQEPDQEVSGSGVIISSDGYIITNNHVIENAKEVEIILPGGSRIPAIIMGTDTFADLAVLKIEGDNVTSPASFGNSEMLSPGETVIAIGSPLGKFQNTVTVGVVSATDRSLRITENYQMEGLIQTDAAINQGNSGGPLINLAGEVIGINTLIVRGGASAVAEGLGFAIPSNRAKAIAEQIIEQGYFSRPYLGINWEWITPGIAAAYNLPAEWGAFISQVAPDTPASQAGLQEGDIIVQFGDRKLNENNPFINALYDHSPGDQVTLNVKRDGETIEVEVTLAKQPSVQ